jgi:hypothetical protein
MSRILLSLLLVCACASTGAREMVRSGANGDGGACPELAATESTVAAADKPRNAAKAPARAKPGKAAPSVRGGGGEGRVSTPRWHSFLPGMFR